MLEVEATLVLPIASGLRRSVGEVHCRLDARFSPQSPSQWCGIDTVLVRLVIPDSVSS